MNRIHNTIAREVAEALRQDRAVVALESTLISHGLPWPENLETARESEAAVRRHGAVPATIAVMHGGVRIGLSDEELESLARSTAFMKASRRDLGAAVALQQDAATTVSATMHVARNAGIHVMATGGLGGVHRGASESFDISLDLDELARADGMLLVCSGVKSILDIPATLEALETRGVLVVGYRCDQFPAFTSRSSGIPIEWRADSPGQVAAIVQEHRAMKIPGAIVLANPVAENVAIADDEANAAIHKAIEDAKRLGIAGKAITPFLLNAVREETSGRSLAANRALIVANAGLAGEVAALLITSVRRA